MSSLHISLSFLPILELKKINTFVLSCSSLETIPDSRPKWQSVYPFSRPKRCKSPTLWVGTYLYGLYRGVHCPRAQVTAFFEPVNRLSVWGKSEKIAKNREKRACSQATAFLAAEPPCKSRDGFSPENSASFASYKKNISFTNWRP